MKQKIYLIDATAEKGHVLFLKRLIQILENDYQIEFISSSVFAKAVERETSVKLKEKWFERPSRIHFVIYQVLVLIKTARYVDKRSSIIFTGFENISFSICSRFFRNRKLFAYLHNNLDKKGISNFFLRNTSKRVSFVAMEDYMRVYFKELVKNETVYIPHPLNLSPNTVTKNENYVFAVNIDLSVSDLREQILAMAGNGSKKVYVKLHADSDFDNELEGVVIQRFYEDYLEKIRNASLIVLQIPYNYRVSGVFYECATLGKPILFIGKKGCFANEMIHKYEFVGQDLSLVDHFQEGNNSDFLQTHGNKKILLMWKQLI